MLHNKYGGKEMPPSGEGPQASQRSWADGCFTRRCWPASGDARRSPEISGAPLPLCLLPIPYTPGYKGACEPSRALHRIGGWLSFGRDIWRWSCPTSPDQAAEEVSPAQAGSPGVSFPRPCPYSFGHLQGWRCASTQLLLVVFRIWLPRATYHLVKQLVASFLLLYVPGEHEGFQRFALVILSCQERPYRSLEASSPHCTTRTGWRATRWFPGHQDWKTTAVTRGRDPKYLEHIT